ncbi:MAG: peptidoglycan-binding domain-containing protein [Christensenellales bacterium]
MDSGYTLLGGRVRPRCKLQGGWPSWAITRRRGRHLRLTTTSAVKAFQRANGLSGDGQAGSQTQTKLYSASEIRGQPGGDGEPIKRAR